jgi:DNA-binding IclR family transcriptional regulator
VSGLAAPIFDEGGSIVAVVSAYGRTPAFDAAWDGPPATALRSFARQTSTIAHLRPN